MKNFIFRVGNKLYNDFLAYYMFKLLIINLNKIYFGILLFINILLWYNTRCDCYPKTDPNVHYTPKLFIALNVFFSLYIATHVLITAVCYADHDEPLFETYLYKKYFDEIETSNK